MHTHNRWQNWCRSAGLALVLAGCSQREAPKVPSGDAPRAAPSAGPQASAPVDVEPAAATDKPAAKPASPVSLEEATRIIDLRTFPMPDGGKDLYKSAEVPKGDREKDLNKSAKEVSYVLRRVNGAQAAQFYRTKLAEAGWKVGDGLDSPDYFTFTSSKQGFFLDGGVFENRAAGELSVSITNHGNIDSRTLPRFAGAELKENDFHRTIYHTDAKPDEVIEFTRAELTKGGWREVRMWGGKIDNEPGFPVILRFIQRGIEITTSVQGKNGKTEVWNIVRVLGVELPIMPEAKGTVEFVDSSRVPLHLFYATPTEPEKVLEFYRKELPGLGWTLRAGTDKIEAGAAKVMLDAPEKDSLRLELLADKQGTFVLIASDPRDEKKDTPSSNP